MKELLKTLSDIDAAAQVRADYTKTIALLNALKSGEVTLDEVVMTDDGWRVDQPSDDADPETDET